MIESRRTCLPSLLVSRVFSLTNKEEAKEGGKSGLASAFSLVALMELGDKTQFASFVLAARYGSPVMVFLGIMLGAALITGSGVVIGKGLMKVMPERYLRYAAAALFLIFGVIFLAKAFLGVDIL